MKYLHKKELSDIDQSCSICKYWFARKDLNNDIGDCLKLCNEDLSAKESIFPKQENEKDTVIDFHSEFLTGSNFLCKHYSHL